MRSGRSLVAATLVLVAGGCAVGDGMRVEGSAPVPTPSRPSSSPEVMRTPEIAAKGGVDAQSVRQVLLTDSRVEPDVKNVVRTCTECTRLGAGTDVIPDGTGQWIATVSLRNGGVFAALLVGTAGAGRVGSGPRVLWSLEGDDMKVSVGTGRTLVVESAVFGPTDRVCCPTGSKLEKYRWNGTRIVKISEQFIAGG